MLNYHMVEEEAKSAMSASDELVLDDSDSPTNRGKQELPVAWIQTSP